MQDKVTLERIELLDPRIREEAKQIYAEICERLKGRAMVRFTRTFTTNADQEKLYAIGRTIKGAIVTNARGGDSYHNYRLAIDVCLILDGKEASWDTKTDFDKDGISDWAEIVAIFKRYGWEWGGDWHFKDMPHFQKTLGLSIQQLKAIAKK